MKKILISFLSLMLVLGIGIGISQLAVQKKAGAELTSTEEFFMVEGAQFRSYWTTTNCGITYAATIPYGHSYTEKIKLFVAPYDYVESAYKSSNTATQQALLRGDYVTAFKQEGLQYLDVEPTRLPSVDVTYLTGGIKNIPNGQESRKYFGIYYFNAGTEQEPNYKYAQMPNGELGQARSIAYLSSGYYNSGQCTAENDQNMTTYFMERAIKTAVSKESGKNGNPTVNANTIVYNKTNKNTKILSGVLSATFLDDYITEKTTVVEVNGQQVNVAKRLDFKVDYSDFDTLIDQDNLSGALINTKSAGTLTKEVEIGLDTVSFTVTVNPFDLKNAQISSNVSEVTFIQNLTGGGTATISGTIKGNLTPTITLTIPKANNMLGGKEFNNDTISKVAELIFSYTDDGSYNSTKFNAIISGGNFINTSNPNNNVSTEIQAIKQTFTVYFASNNTNFGTVSPISIANVIYGTEFTTNGNILTLNTLPNSQVATATTTANGAQYSYSFNNWTNVSGTQITSGTITADNTIFKANFRTKGVTF